MGALIFLIVIILLVINCAVAASMETIAEKKGYEHSNVYIMCFFLGIAGWLYVVALPDLIQRKNQENLMELLKDNKNEEF